MSKILIVLAIVFSVIALATGTKHVSAHEGNEGYVSPQCEVVKEIEFTVQKERKITYTVVESGGQYTNTISYPKKETRLIKQSVPCAGHDTNAPPLLVTWQGISENEDNSEIYISGNFAVDPYNVVRFTKPTNEPQNVAMVARIDGTIGFNGILVVDKDTQTVKFAGHNVGHFIDGNIVWNHQGVLLWPNRVLINAVVLPNTLLLIDGDNE